MSRLTSVKHEFVRTMPRELEEGTLYVSVHYATASHRCCCGCGNRVVTPISPTDWKVTFDGESISLYPSIGNWNFPCRSHYWIRNDRVDWARLWSEREVGEARASDALSKRAYFQQSAAPAAPPGDGGPGKRPGLRFWQWLRSWRPGKKPGGRPPGGGACL